MSRLPTSRKENQKINTNPASPGFFCTYKIISFTGIMQRGAHLSIYRSSAGSGKTFTLVKEYLKLVLADTKAYRKILAITFTNKATEEMKSRIIGQLIKISGGGEGGYIRTHLELPFPEEETAAKAAEVLSNIMHDYSGFAITTIDSFFSSIVRNLARELNLPMRFEMELSTDHVIREITFDLLEESDTNEDLSSWLQEYLLDLLDNEKGWKIEPKIHETAKQLFSDEFRRLHENKPHKIVKSFVKELKQIINSTESEANSFAEAFFTILDQHSLSVEDLKRKKSGPSGTFIKLKKGSATLPELNPTFLKAAENAEEWFTTSAENAELIHAVAEEKLLPLSQKVLEFYERQIPYYNGALAVLKLIYLSGLLGRLNEKLRDYRAATDTILLSDVNYMLKDAIDEQDAPFIFEKAGNRYLHFMLDEFQDTSRMQWHNLYPLLLNSLSLGNSSLIVGDAKQSIYRWRGGDMELLQTGVEKDLHHFESVIESKFLGDNWRSSETIISFNNLFFPDAAIFLAGKQSDPMSTLIRDVYKPDLVTQQFKKGKAGEGFVSIKIFDRKEDDEKNTSDEEAPSKGWGDRSMTETCNTINELLKKGFRLSDMAILCRTNQDAIFITSHLLLNGITSIISPESLLLTGSREVRLLIRLIRYLQDASDDITLAHICCYASLKSGEDIDALLAEGKHAMEMMLPEGFVRRRDALLNLTLYELVEELCLLFKLNNKPDAYIQRFHDLVQEYVQKNPPGLSDFLEWWDENNDSDACSVNFPDGKNAIRIMSIHKSKGLEFRIVFIPLCGWSFGSRPNQTMWATSTKKPFDQLEAHLVNPGKRLINSVFSEDNDRESGLQAIDNLNLMYVAFTRAKEQLYVHAQGPPKNRKEDTAYNAGLLVLDVINGNEQWKRLLHNSEDHSVELGTIPEPAASDEVKKEGVELTKWISEPWKDKLWLGVNKRKIARDDPEHADTAYGLLFHDYMSKFVHTKEPSAIAAAIQNLNLPDATLRDRLIKEVHYVVSEGSDRNWFAESAEIFCEREMLTQDGKLLRPDRVVISETGVQVIDYKTGSEEPWHADQVKVYGSVLKEMGYPEPRLFLVYPALRKVAEVTT
ncbi:MAG TPA: UvrD-helicase domain-containing protein [Bacteroidia bacterium]|nr:UvrD-helicase domain-containing protein [Bacteroidia bacterium]